MCQGVLHALLCGVGALGFCIVHQDLTLYFLKAYSEEEKVLPPPLECKTGLSCGKELFIGYKRNYNYLTSYLTGYFKSNNTQFFQGAIMKHLFMWLK